MASAEAAAALVERIQAVLLWARAGFAVAGQQYRLTVDEEFAIDLGFVTWTRSGFVVVAPQDQDRTLRPQFRRPARLLRLLRRRQPGSRTTSVRLPPSRPRWPRAGSPALSSPQHRARRRASAAHPPVAGALRAVFTHPRQVADQRPHPARSRT